MKITLLVVGATNSPYIKQGIEDYLNRIKHYIPFEVVVIKEIRRHKKLSGEVQKKKEGELIIKYKNSSNVMVLLDERGGAYSSRSFSAFIQKKMASGLKELVFVVGGPYGFSNEVYNMAQDKISFSKMTFPHELIRLFFIEQLYRAFTILKGEPYHHD